MKSPNPKSSSASTSIDSESQIQVLTKKIDSIDEKLTYLFKYQKQLHFWTVTRAVISVILFVIFIVIPILYTIYIGRHLFSYFGDNFDQFEQVLDGLKVVGSAKDTIDSSVGGFGENLEGVMENLFK